MQIASDIAIPIAICLASQVDVLLAATARAAYDPSTGRTSMTVPASPQATVIPLSLLGAAALAAVVGARRRRA